MKRLNRVILGSFLKEKFRGNSFAHGFNCYLMLEVWNNEDKERGKINTQVLHLDDWLISCMWPLATTLRSRQDGWLGFLLLFRMLIFFLNFQQEPKSQWSFELLWWLPHSIAAEHSFSAVDDSTSSCSLTLTLDSNILSFDPYTSFCILCTRT